MLLKYYKRGNVFEFTAEPKDVNGDPVTPDTVTSYVNYIASDGERTTVPVVMEENTDGVWTAEWDSSIAKKGRVHWHVRTVNPSSAKEDQFELEANLANPDPEETA